METIELKDKEMKHGKGQNERRRNNWLSSNLANKYCIAMIGKSQEKKILLIFQRSPLFSLLAVI